MWINKKKYNELFNYEKINEELEKEVKRLASLVSEQVKDCNIGPWCKDCKYMGEDKSTIEIEDPFSWYWCDYTAGKVTYCKKHLCEICQEFEIKD